MTHACHGKTVGAVLTLGEGDTGQLGLGPDVLERNKPAPVPGLEQAVQVCAGGMHTVVLMKDGKVCTTYCDQALIAENKVL